MTILSEDAFRQSLGDGVTTVFATPALQKAEDLTVYLDDDIVSPASFVLTGVGNPAGASIAFTVAPALGVQVLRLRMPLPTQSVVYKDGNKFPAASHEGALDRLEMRVQALQYRLNRAVRLPDHAPALAAIAYADAPVLSWASGPVSVSPYLSSPRTPGVTDDTEAFRKALAIGGVVYCDPGEIYVIKDLVLDGKTIEGNGCGFRDASGASFGFKLKGYRPALNNCFIQDQGNVAKVTSLASGALIGATSLSVSSGAGFVTGQVIFVEMDGTIERFVTVITNVVGATITIRDALPGAAASGKEVVAIHGLVWVEDAAWWTVDKVQTINTHGGFLIKPSSPSAFSNLGTLSNCRAGDFKYFGYAKVENAAGVKALDLKLWGGWVQRTLATGNGTAGPFSFPHPVFLKRDLTIAVDGVLKTLGTHYTISSTNQISFTLGNYPANGASIVIDHFRDGYIGFLEDQRNTAIISGGNCYSQVEVLDGIVGVYCNSAELTDFDNLISDGISGKAIRLDACDQTVRFGQTFLGFSNQNIQAFSSTIGVNFSELYTKLVPASDAYTAPTVNIAVDNSNISINVANWTGGDYAISESGGGRVDMRGAIMLTNNSLSAVAAGTTTFLGPGGVHAGSAAEVLAYPGQCLKIVALCDTAPGVGQSFTYTLNINGVDTSRVLTISGGSSFSASLVFVEGFSAPASICLKLVTSAGAASARHRCVVVAK